MEQLQYRVLMLGAGFVAKPALEILHHAGITITVACNDLEAAQRLCRGFENAVPIYLDVTKQHELDMAVTGVDLVISLIPYTFHTFVIQSAIREKKHVVTTSYVSPAMKELDIAAKAAGILVLNECGLDPGIDHLLAILTVHDVHRAGGSIKSLRSYCGALPAPESADNPLGYKFSWSPRGVLLALKNPAKFYLNGIIHEVAGEKLMGQAWPFSKADQFDLVAYPNRDSTTYRDHYDIPEASTVIRNTLRYARFPIIMQTLANVGFLSEQHMPYLTPSGKELKWRDVSCLIIGAMSPQEMDLIAAIVKRNTFTSDLEQAQVIDGLRWIGLFSDEAASLCQTPLDTLCSTLEHKLKYSSEERDLVIFQHQFEIEHQSGHLETRLVSLTEFGKPGGDSALAKLVGVTCAIAAEKILNGSISGTGVKAPLNWAIVEPILDALKLHGICPQIDRSFSQRTKGEWVSQESTAIEVA